MPVDYGAEGAVRSYQWAGASAVAVTSLAGLPARTLTEERRGPQRAYSEG